MRNSEKLGIRYQLTEETILKKTYIDPVISKTNFTEADVISTSGAGNRLDDLGMIQSLLSQSEDESQGNG